MFINKIIKDHLNKLGIKKNDNLCIHSDLSSFGIHEKKLPKFIITIIKKKIGKNGSIVMPSYSLDINNINTLSEKKIYKKNNGILSYYLKNNYNVVESKSLIHSHIGIGKNIKFLKKTPINRSFGLNSDFNFFKKKNFKLLLLGCRPNQGATYIHQIEYIAKVPYRKKKIIILNYKKNNIKYCYFARSDKKIFENFDDFFKKIKKNYLSAELKYGSSYIIPIKILHNLGMNFIKKNKYTFVKKL
jgi:aminoglycoside N3'-acetyltransferase